MNVLIACEFSGTTRDAFIARGHNAWSCDILATEAPGPHIQANVLDHLDGFYPGHGKSPVPWDLMIAHPPCTHLSLSGARWCTDHLVQNKKGNWWHDGSEKRRMRDAAVKFFRALLEAPIDRICIENPMSRASTLVRPKNQIIQPWQFGHGEQKQTWLWLKNLPPLEPTNIVEGREERVFHMTPADNRGHERSRSYPGIADAMAAQWGFGL